MSLTKDGFWKQMGATTGNDNYVLLAGGGHKQWTNNNTANALVSRDGSGDIYVRYAFATLFNSSAGDENITIGSIYIRNTSDNYIRRISRANFGAQMRDSGTMDGRWVKKAGDTMTGQLYINYDQDVGLNQNGSLVIGNKAGENLAFDGNEIMARNNSAAATLYLQAEGGNLNSSAGTNYFSGNVGIGVSPSYKLHVSGTSYLGGNTTVAGHLYVSANNTYNLGASGTRWARAYIGSADSYGSTTKPIYWNAGVPTACTYELKTTVNSGTANRVAWYNGSAQVAYTNIVTDSNYLSNISYLSVNTGHQTSYRLYVGGPIYISDRTILSDNQIIVPVVSASTLASSYGYDNSGNTEKFIKAWCKWVYAQSGVPNRTAHSYISPNSRGYIIADVYSSGLVDQTWKNNNTSYPNAEIGLPVHITGRYYPHGGTEIYFGTSYGTWYYNSVSVNGHNHDGRYLRRDTNDSSSYQYTFSKTNDHAIQVGTLRGYAVGSQTGNYLHIYERVHIGSPNGWGSRSAPSYGLSTYGGAWLATDTGSVGIGTTSPSYKLHVAGSTYITDYVGIGTTPNSSHARLIFPINNRAIAFQTTDGYRTYVQYMSTGNEALVFAAKNAVTSFIFKSGHDLANGSDWQSSVIGTPSVQIKGQSLYVNTAIANGSTPGYNFYVSGNSWFTGLINSIHVKAVTLANSTSWTTNFDTNVFDSADNSNYKFTVIRCSSSAPDQIVNDYGTGIAWKGSDTKGMISVKYGSPLIKFAGGSGTSNLTWWIGISGTNGVTYNLASFNADTLDGYHASGLFTVFGASGNALSLTIGGTTRTYIPPYATLSNKTNTVIAHHTITGSTSNAQGKWIKFATIDLSSGNWTPFDETWVFGATEGATATPRGILKLTGRRAGSDDTVTDISLKWLTLDNIWYQDKVILYKRAANTYDVYISNYGGYETMNIVRLTGYYDNVTFGNGTWGDLPGTATYTSSLGGNVSNADTLDGIHASGLFTNFSNAGSQTTSITIGGTNRTLKIDADMTDGLHVHGGRNNEANKIVRTDGSGYIQAGWINTTSGDMGTTAIDRVYCSNDGYIRYKTKQNFANELRDSGYLDGRYLRLSGGTMNSGAQIIVGSIANSSGNIYNGGIQLRERGYSTTSLDGTVYTDGPGITFHWGGRWVHMLNMHSNDIFWDNNRIWHAGNDGSGSGLDADLLDGIHASGLFTNFSNAGSQTTSITIGGTNRTLKIDADLLDGYHWNSFVHIWGGTDQNFNIADGGKVSGIYYGHNNWSQSNKPETYGLLADFNNQAAHLQLWGGSDNSIYARSYWWTSNPNGFTYPGWVKLLHSGNYTSYVNNYYWANVKISTTSNASTSPTFNITTHNGEIQANAGIMWKANTNIRLPQTANSQEWSFDITRNGYTGGYWQVWDSAYGSLLCVYATEGDVLANRNLGVGGRNTGYKFYVNGTSYFNGNVTHAGHVYPASSHNYNIGSGSLYWRSAFIMGYGGQIYPSNLYFNHMWNPASGATQTNWESNFSAVGIRGLGKLYYDNRLGNKIAGMPLAAITVNVTNDGGSTWQDVTTNTSTAVNYNITDRIMSNFYTSVCIAPGKITENKVDYGTNGTHLASLTGKDGVEVILDFTIENRVGYIDVINMYQKSYLTAGTFSIDYMATGASTWTNIYTRTLSNTQSVDENRTIYLGQGLYMNGTSTSTSNADNHIRIKKLKFKYISTSFGSGDNIRYAPLIGNFAVWGRDSISLPSNSTYKYTTGLSRALAQRDVPYFVNINTRRHGASSTIDKTNDLYMGSVTIPANVYLSDDYGYTAANVDKRIYLHIGNSTDISGNNAHCSGSIQLYSTNQYYTEIRSQGNGNRIFYLPNFNSTMYAVHAENNNAIGSATQPVYIATNGRVTACTTYAAYVTGCYWANVKISTSSSTDTNPTFNHVYLKGYLYMNDSGGTMRSTIDRSGNSPIFGYGQGQAGYHVYYTGRTVSINGGTSWSSTANGIYINDSNNIGIGTNAPSYKLHVAGTVYSTGAPAFYAYASAGNWAYLRLHNSSNYWDIATNSSGDSGALDFRPGGANNIGPRFNTNGRAQFATVNNGTNNYDGSSMWIREYHYGGSQSDSWGNAPRLGWHWSGRVAAQIGLSSNGWLYEAPLTATNFYRIVVEGSTGVTWGINISGNADTVDSQHFTYSNSSNSPTYLWGTNSNGTSFLASRTAITVGYATRLGSSNVGNSITPIWLNGGLATAVSIYRVHYDGNENWASYKYHKVAYIENMGSYSDVWIRFAVSSGDSASRVGELYLRYRTNGNKLYESLECNWLYRNSGIPLTAFKALYTNDTTNNTSKAELWVEIPGRWCGYMFRVIDSGGRGNNGSLGWVLCDSNTSNGSASLPSATGTIDSYDGTKGGMYWANLSIQTTTNNDTQPRFGYVGIGTGVNTSYRLNISGNSLLAGTTYFGSTSYWINNSGVEYMGDIRGARIRLYDNWIGFYTSGNAGGNRLGYIQADGSYMYFRKENGNAGFNFNGNLVPSSNLAANIGTNTLSWNRTFTRYLDTRHLDASAECTSDMDLYIGYGAATPTQNIRFYYSTGTRNSGATSRSEFMRINSNGAYALTRFGVNGQNTSYTFYVSGTSYLGGNTTVAGHLYVSANNTYNLGASGTRWKALFIGSADSYGSTTKPIYWNAGVPTACTYELKTTVNSGTANRVAWYNGSVQVASSSIVTDGGYLGSVTWLSVNHAHQTSYRVWVEGDSYSTAWCRAGNGFYTQSGGVYYTHTGNYMEVSSNGNEMVISGTSATDMHINYRANSLSRTNPTNYIWHINSSSTWANHYIGNLRSYGYVAINNDINTSYRLYINGNTYSNGVLYTNEGADSWISGMTTNPRIWYNGGNAIDASSYWAFWAMKSSSSHVINFGGLGNNIGFLGYYAGRTANDYDWRLWCDTANGMWDLYTNKTNSTAKPALMIRKGWGSAENIAGDTVVISSDDSPTLRLMSSNSMFGISTNQNWSSIKVTSNQLGFYTGFSRTNEIMNGSGGNFIMELNDKKLVIRMGMKFYPEPFSGNLIDLSSYTSYVPSHIYSSNSNAEGHSVLFLPEPTSVLVGSIIYIHHRLRSGCSFYIGIRRSGDTTTNVGTITSNAEYYFNSTKYMMHAGGGEAQYIENDTGHTDDSVFYLCIRDTRFGRYMWKEYWCG